MEPFDKKTLSVEADIRIFKGFALNVNGRTSSVKVIAACDERLREVSMLVVSPTESAFETYEPEIQKMLDGLVVTRVTQTHNARADRGAAAPQAAGGKLVIPAPTRVMTVADLAGEWGQNDGITTTYVDRYTGTYAGFESLHFTNKGTITSQGGLFFDFFGLQNGRKLSEQSTGRVTLAGGVLVVTMKNTQRYVLRGWLERPDITS